MKENGTWIQATKKSLDQLEVPETVSKVGLCDGFGLALEVLGRPITNSIMLGVVAKTLGIVSLDSLNKGMETTAFRDALLEKNVEAAKRGYEETHVYDISK
jgi:Pyruvate/2-oxoacid:ferredoxin oxidoreductase gamma subunit